MPCGRPGVKVKICGLTRAEDVRTCVDAEVDFLGFNTWPGSPRYVTAEAARGLASTLPDTCRPVAVCVWTDPRSVEEALATGFEWIQVHETPSGWRWPEVEESHTLVRALKAREPLSSRELTGAHFYLVDTPSRQLGGSGQTFDWSLLERIAGDERLFLAGGLRPDNVAAAIAAVRPCAVDVASGVEEKPGIKSPAAVQAFVRAVLGEA